MKKSHRHSRAYALCAVPVASFWKPMLPASQAFQKAWRKKGGCPSRTNPLSGLHFSFRVHYSVVPPGIASPECYLVVSCVSLEFESVVGQILGKCSSLLKLQTSPLHTAGPQDRWWIRGKWMYCLEMMRNGNASGLLRFYTLWVFPSPLVGCAGPLQSIIFPT